MSIKRFDNINVGEYICKGTNSFGEDSKKVSISMRTVPVVTIDPLHLNLKKGQRGSVKCSVQEVEGNYSFWWKVGSEYVDIDVSNCSTSYSKN